jgi:hypothetical protein
MDDSSIFWKNFDLGLSWILNYNFIPREENFCWLSEEELDLLDLPLDEKLGNNWYRVVAPDCFYLEGVNKSSELPYFEKEYMVPLINEDQYQVIQMAVSVIDTMLEKKGIFSDSEKLSFILSQRKRANSSRFEKRPKKKNSKWKKRRANQK